MSDGSKDVSHSYTVFDSMSSSPSTQTVGVEIFMLHFLLELSIREHGNKRIAAENETSTKIA